LATLNQLWVPFGFHAICMIGGVACLQAARRRRAVAAQAARV